MWKWTTYLLRVLIGLALMREYGFAAQCSSRYPKNTKKPKSPVDENFVLSITGNAQTYILGQSYNVSLHAYNGRRFIGAKLVLENDNGDIGFNEDLGHMEVTDPVETRFSSDCVNMIETTNTNPKAQLDMAWTAPTQPGSGCVLIRATVLQHRDVWFMDDGLLTKRICEESVDDVESQKKDDEQRECCACDEARYEITFEGVWSRNLHPKDFPAKGWLTKFSDILGAAHTSDYRFWDSGVLASPAMQEFAEHGSARGLEMELNHYFKQRKIRTILKARGPSFPYMNAPTIASIRVDPARHQLSMASKIVPSPDWIVGVAGLELCLPNCTWIEEKSISLYPWDCGTDAGPTYTSPDQPQVPPDVIRRMRSDFPSDPRSPFYDEDGVPMKPMAMLSLKRVRLYERKCRDEDSNNSDDIPRECHTHPWSDWSECSVNCGIGTRQRTRVYKQADVASIYNCDGIIERRQVEPCQGECAKTVENPWSELPINGEDFLEQELQPMRKSEAASYGCRMGQWGPWSACNATCGAGVMIRRRKLLDRNAGRECQDQLFEKKSCFVHNVACRSSGPTQVVGDTNDNYNNYDNENSGYNENFEVDDGNQLETGGNFYNGQDGSQDQFAVGSGVTDFNFPSDNSHTNFQYGSVRREYPGSVANNDFNENESQMSYYIPTENLKQEPPYGNYMMPESQYQSRNGNFQYLRGPWNALTGEREREREIGRERRTKVAYQRSSPPVGYDTRMLGFSNVDDNVPVPPFCYEPLTVVQCSDSRVVGNFWFYNFCRGECMLYASDICDRNRNSFPSLEQCQQQCAEPMRNAPTFLRRKQQQSAECQRIERRNNRKWRGYVV